VQGSEVTLSRIPENAAIALCDAEGKVLSRQNVNGPKVLLKALNVENAIYIKLFSSKYLVDAQEVAKRIIR